jgi:pyruvate/2-oxoglutarate dehydrogenase complex dihydrolipoamide dehydrogenase (E3) component
MAEVKTRWSRGVESQDERLSTPRCEPRVEQRMPIDRPLRLIRRDAIAHILRIHVPFGNETTTIDESLRSRVMAQIERYEVLTIGSGEAGKYMAWTMAKAGHRTAVIERKLVGGSCPNIACLPSKNIIHSAKVASLAGRAEEFGLELGSLSVNMQGVQRRKRKMVADLIDLHIDRYTSSGAELIMGSARFVGPRTVEVSLSSGGTRVIAGERVFLNLGTHAAIPDVPGLMESQPMTHVEALDLDRLPEHLVVLGGGYVGLELAQAFRRFGSRVTVFEIGPQLAGQEDGDVAGALMDLFQDEGIQVLLRTEVRQVEGRSGQKIRVHCRGANGEQIIEATDLLVAAGRTPNARGIGLDQAGVELDGKGYVKVNERLETTASNIWAMGDCAGSPHFTHVAFDDFRIVRDNLGGGHRTTRNRLVPFCIFTDPELARVGLNELEAKNRGLEYRVAKMPMGAVLRTRTLSEPRGFMKILIDADSDRILGFTAFGVEASEPMSIVQTAMLAELPYTALRDAIFTHPTVAEGLTVLLSNVAAKGVRRAA